MKTLSTGALKPNTDARVLNFLKVPRWCPSRQVDFMHAVGIVYEDKAGNILILKRHAKSSIEAGKWGLVGGGVDSGEDVLEAAIRETKEEIYWDIQTDLLKHFNTYRWSRNGHTLTFDVYYCIVDKRPSIVLQTEENVEYKWINPAEAYARGDLMERLYIILKDIYHLK